MLYTIREGISNEKKLLLNYVKSFFLFLNQVLLETYIYIYVYLFHFCV